MKKMILPVIPMLVAGMMVFGPDGYAKANSLNDHLLVKKDIMRRAPKILVTGKVVDEAGEPLLGVTVLEKGSNKGTVTNADGSFSIETIQGATLVFSFVGFVVQQVVVSVTSPLTIQMK